MSQSSAISLTCPKCQHEQEFTLWNSINVALDPEKKAELKNGSLTRFTCTECGNASDVNYPILYHDPEHRFMVWLSSDDTDPDLAGLPLGEALHDYRLRLVKSRNHLVEKSHIFESGLDDLTLELFKVMMRANPKECPQGELLFGGLGKDQDDSQELEFAILTDEETKFMGAKKEAYDNYSQMLAQFADSEQLAPGEWHRVDQNYAVELVRRHLPNAAL